MRDHGTAGATQALCGIPPLNNMIPPQLPGEGHVDASYSADAETAWDRDQQRSLPRAIPQNLPPFSWITGARNNSQH